MFDWYLGSWRDEYVSTCVFFQNEHGWPYIHCKPKPQTKYVHNQLNQHAKFAYCAMFAPYWRTLPVCAVKTRLRHSGGSSSCCSQCSRSMSNTRRQYRLAPWATRYSFLTKKTWNSSVFCAILNAVSLPHLPWPTLQAASAGLGPESNCVQNLPDIENWDSIQQWLQFPLTVKVFLSGRICISFSALIQHKRTKPMSAGPM